MSTVRRSLRIASQKLARNNCTAEEKESAIHDLKEIHKNTLLNEWYDLSATLDKLESLMEQTAAGNKPTLIENMNLYEKLRDACWNYHAATQYTIDTLDEKMLIGRLSYLGVMSNLGCHINTFVKSFKYYTQYYNNTPFKVNEIYKNLCVNLTKQVNTRMR